ncbi:MAG: AhpC/TSA family protein [Muribaculaceae bacterium]|uniref:TlpA disulfide reductase family protein n=1 Tax=uncultured Duncaniella sp. TaxID=2768039 RepID=UPI002633B478|nr:TlpA disulfide reductase family protein [uncultured Duncaniella sp.]MCI8999174.1 AhpC/TSA family protein [Muribaculaceae bacterium]
MRRSLIVVLLLVTATISATAIDYVVQGQIEGMDGKLLYLHDYDKEITIDSTLVTNGRFKFHGSYERPALVRVENGRFFSNCILDTLAVVNFDTHYPSAGSLLNQKMINFSSENQTIEDELDKFRDELINHGFEQPELGEIYKHLFDKLFPRRLQLLYQTIEDNPNGVGEYAIMSLGSLWGVTPEQWDEAYSKMSPYLKRRRIADYYNNKYNGLRNSQPGKPFIDINAKTVSGEDVKLSDYVGKGKYVLLDFWASWCGPCREEAEKTLRPLYEKYKDDDRFMILGVATWDEHDKTVAALEKRNYPWTQIIDAGEVPMKLYGFNGIPMIFLINPDGIIIERELRGEGIISLVDNILSTNKPNQ